MRDSCGYQRDAVTGAKGCGSAPTTKTCGLLQILSGVEADQCGLCEDACKVCLSLDAEPTVEQPGRVVASLLVGVGRKIGGERGAKLHEQARRFLPHTKTRRSRQDEREKEPDSATIGRMAVAAARAAGKFVANGCKTTPQEVRAYRRSFCEQCEHWTGKRCKLCGCWTALKFALPGESCPIGKWGPALSVYDIQKQAEKAAAVENAVTGE